MYIPWEWIKEKTRYSDDYPIGKFIEKLNYYGLECEQNFTDEILFINFITAHNRKDLKSWWGLVREIFVLLNIKKTIHTSGKKKKKYNRLSTSIGNLPFVIKSKQVIEYNLLSLHSLCKNKCLPTWMLQSLTKNGIRSINPVVDIANFASLETGQPFHVFDLEKLQNLSGGREITIREARGGELFTDLAEKEWKLTAGSLLMETNQQVVELIGISGGSRTAIEQTTREFLIESGSFSARTIEQTSKQLGISTRASETFINAHNQENSREALERFEEIISQFYNYQPGRTEYFSPLVNEKKLIDNEIMISTAFLEKKLGIPLSEEKIEVILERLTFPFKKKNTLYIIKIPAFRSDLQNSEDLLEEIGKLLDYNLLPGKLPVFQNQFIDLQFNNTYRLKRKLALYLMSNGYQEILSYSLTADLQQEENSILLNNPSSRERVAYRTSFINSHLGIVKHNQGQGSEDLFLFEIGNIYSKGNDSNPPIQEEILLVTTTGRIINSQLHQLSQQVDLYWMKGLLENLLMVMGIDEFTMGTVEITSSTDLNYPLLINGKKIGFIRQLSPETLAQNGIQKKDSFVLQLSFSKLLLLLEKQEVRKYSLVSYLPTTTRNLSFLIEKSISLELIIAVIKNEGGEFLLQVSLVDVYLREKESALHSLNFQLLFQGRDVNLQNTEIEVKIEQIWKVLIRKFSVLRR